MRKPADAFEAKGIREIPATERDLTSLILEHRDPARHVPPGLAGAILELARLDGTDALDKLNRLGMDGGAPVIEYSVVG